MTDNLQRVIDDLRAKGDEPSAVRLEAIRDRQADLFTQLQTVRQQMDALHAMRPTLIAE